MDSLLDIDLDKALLKISQRQSLNQVHYTVQLIRDALTRSPDVISVENGGGQFRLVHQGTPLSANEWQTLKNVALSDEPQTRNMALEDVEQKRGIALIAVLLSGWQVDLRSGSMGVQADGKSLAFTQLPTPLAGFELTIKRPTKYVTEEAHELAYFCAQSDVKIRLNGKDLVPTVDDDEWVLTAQSDDKKGRGVTGMLATGSVSRTTYYKCGIRFGVKYGQSRTGTITSSNWNSYVSRFEPHYAKSIEQGDEAIKTLIKHLYHQVPDHYSDMSEGQQERVKTLLIRYSTPAWERLFGKLPLFTRAQNGNASVHELRKIESHFAYLPYISPGTHHALPLPILRAEEVAFLRGLGFTLKEAHQKRTWLPTWLQQLRCKQMLANSSKLFKNLSWLSTDDRAHLQQLLMLKPD